MQSIVIPMVAELPHFLSTDYASASWAITATLLGAAVSMPVAGRLADIYGKKPVLMSLAVVLLVGCVVSALAGGVTVFIVGRVLQGVAIGYLPVAISLVREVAPPHRRASAIAAVSATLGAGGAAAVPISAWVTETYSWHAAFWMSAIFAVVVLLLTWLVVPAMQDGHAGGLDVVGVVGLALGLGGLLVGASKGSVWGWSSPRILTVLVGGAVVLAMWVVHQLAVREPLVDLRTLAARPVLFTNLAGMLIGFGMMISFVVVPQVLELARSTGYGLGQSVLAAGLWMAPGGLTMMLCAPVSSRLIAGVGARLTLVIGAVALASGHLVGMVFRAAPWQLTVAMCIASAGVGIAYAALPTIVLDHLPESEAASGVAVNALLRLVGTSLASAVLTAVLTAGPAAASPGAWVPAESAVAACFLLGAVVTLVAAAGALAIPAERRPAAATAAAVEGDRQAAPARVAVAAAGRGQATADRVSEDSARPWTAEGAWPAAPGVHRIPLPLPMDALQAVNVYAVEGPDGITLVDGGWAVEGAREVLDRSLRTLGAGLGDVRRILVTHVHRDHYTLAAVLGTELGVEVWLGEGERPALDVFRAGIGASRAASVELLVVAGAHDLAQRWGAAIRGPVDLDQWRYPDRWVEADGVLDVGGRPLEAVRTPGHTPGHLVFVDPKHHVMFAGDHVLPSITPSIGFTSPAPMDPLGDFLSSLARVRAQPDRRLLPAHGPVAPSVHRRVDELLLHHEQRLDLAHAVMPARASATAFAVAQALPWTRHERRFAELGDFDQVLATRETLAHLEVLAARGRLHRSVDGHGVVRFAVAEPGHEPIAG